MTLPPEIEKIRDELAEQHGIQVAKHFHERLPGTKFFGIPQEPFDNKPDFKTQSSYRSGFKACFEILLKREDRRIPIKVEYPDPVGAGTFFEYKEVSHHDHCNLKIKDLQAQLSAAIEALEFYADKGSWNSVTVEDTNRRFCILSGSDLEYFEQENQNSYCGKRARKTLAKLKEMK